MHDANRAIQRCEEQRIAAITAGDIDTLGTLLADDLVYVHNNGLQETKAEYLKTAAQIEYRRFEPREQQIRLYGGVGIVNGHADIEVRFQGRELAMAVRYTAVYVDQDDAWRLTSWHASAVV